MDQSLFTQPDLWGVNWKQPIGTLSLNPQAMPFNPTIARPPPGPSQQYQMQMQQQQQQQQLQLHLQPRMAPHSWQASSVGAPQPVLTGPPAPFSCPHSEGALPVSSPFFRVAPPAAGLSVGSGLPLAESAASLSSGGRSREIHRMQRDLAVRRDLLARVQQVSGGGISDLMSQIALLEAQISDMKIGGGASAASPASSTGSASSSAGHHSGGRRVQSEQGTSAKRSQPVPSASEEAYAIRFGPDGGVLDKRTTLMIRNIPNKYSQRQLLDKIERSHSNAFDFCYLPIDMRSGANVGYAFINFVSPEFIAPFYAEFNGKKWEHYSEKVCQVSYARLQGLQAIIDHFTGSAVLTLDKMYHPVVVCNGIKMSWPVNSLMRVSNLGGRDFLFSSTI
eukprot:m51a1_g4141 putative mei2-like protein (392) ;mRNA; r:218792-220339